MLAPPLDCTPRGRGTEAAANRNRSDRGRLRIDRSLSAFYSAHSDSMFHRTQLLLDQVDAYEKAGQWQAAVRLCESVFTNAVRSRQIGEMLEVLLRLGLLHSTRSDVEVALEYFQFVQTIADLNGDPSRAARAVNGMGVLFQRMGDISAAESSFREARPYALKGGDRRTTGDIEMNLGILANIRGESHQALRFYESALKEYEAISHQHRIARLLNNLGMLYIDLQDLGRASESLDRALHLCRLSGDILIEGIVLTNKTELMLALGELERARSSCDEAFEIASRLGNSELKAEVLKSYGVIYQQIGRFHLAESHFRQAIDLASSLGYPLVEAEAYREMSLCLRTQDRNKEALEALYKSHGLFTALQAKQDQAEIDKRFAQLEADFLSLVTKWGESIEAKDRYTSGHCQRVAEYACRIAGVVGLSSRDLVWFRMGAFLHDVGKTDVPAEILNKPGRLTDDERLTIERHTIAGDEMLSSIAFPWDIRPMVRSHHERWDGKGYPDGLAGEAIPLTARILRIADVYDALTTSRSYREPLAAEAAFELMERDVGGYDPHLFQIFRDLFPEIRKITHPDQSE
jgi:putative nucleotidyltransferase with HDIG domain